MKKSDTNEKIMISGRVHFLFNIIHIISAAKE
jgi:hypothetical protein